MLPYKSIIYDQFPFVQILALTHFHLHLTDLIIKIKILKGNFLSKKNKASVEEKERDSKEKL
jgi:hypothetical protein